MGTRNEWASKKCAPCEGGVAPMSDVDVLDQLKALDGWTYEAGEIVRTFQFKNYYQTMAFVNAAAWVAHAEDHHPELVVGYKTCTVRYATHSIGGISTNDLICAAKLDALVE